jgi:hypothetical protein
MLRGWTSFAALALAEIGRVATGPIPCPYAPFAKLVRDLDAAMPEAASPFVLGRIARAADAFASAAFRVHQVMTAINVASHRRTDRLRGAPSGRPSTSPSN